MYYVSRFSIVFRAFMSLSIPRRRLSPVGIIIILLIATALMAGIYYVFLRKGGDEMQAPSAPPVEVVTIRTEPFRIWNEFSGRITAVDSVEIRPQVGGSITEIRFQEGAQVNAGDVLFVIDPRPYKAAYDQAVAALNAARSQANLANVELKRAQSLVKQQFLSKSNYDQRVSSAKVATSTIEQAEANVKQTKLNLDYAYVKAPISGKVGRPEITIGNLVQAGPNASLLTTIVANDKMYAEFDVDEQTYIEYMRLKNVSGDMPVELHLASDGTSNPVVYKGELQSFDNQLNTQSGTIRARAIFENSDGALIPGMYATIRLGSAQDVQGILLSERAIGTDQNRKFVYIVNAEDKTEYREVKLGSTVGNKRIILSGLQDNDQVIATGLQTLRPQMPVTPTEVKAEAISADLASSATPAESEVKTTGETESGTAESPAE